MFLFGLRDRDLIAQILRIVLCHAAVLLLVFLLSPVLFYIGAISGTLLSARMIVAEVVKRHPAISFSQQIRRVYAFPKNSLHRRISYYYAISGTVFFALAVIYIGAHAGSLGDLPNLLPAMFIFALGYPGVVNLILLLHPISRAEEEA